jgi:hypothetical protein
LARIALPKKREKQFGISQQSAFCTKIDTSISLNVCACSTSKVQPTSTASALVAAALSKQHHEKPPRKARALNGKR